MRRLLVVFAILGFGLASASAAPSAAAAAASSRDARAAGNTALEDARRGVVLDGLRRTAPNSPCRGNFELARHRELRPDLAGVVCTHGPDPAPDGFNVQVRRQPIGSGVAASGESAPAGGTAAATTVPCYGNGSDGYRVELIYARASNAPDRYPSYAASFNQWAANIDNLVNASATDTGGVRHVRFVTDPSCNLVVNRVTLTPQAVNDFDYTISELRSQGFNRTDRKYLVWMDANVYCGIAQVYYDDSPSTLPGINASNGHPLVPGEVARVDNGCWGLSNSVEAHELVHTLGGVQTSAPNATPFNHCTDDSDRMCYADGSGGTLKQVCPGARENYLDCNHDDYFSTAPAPGSYLSTHWNTASSAFLATTDPVVPSGARFNPVSPSRILDTRTGNGAPAAKVGQSAKVDLQVTGRGGVPASGVSAVVMNVTVTEPTAASFLTAYPAGEAVPDASNLNYGPNQTVPNLVTVKVGAGGKVSLRNNAGNTHMIADVAGWYDAGSAASGSRFNPVSPSRILDTRTGNGAPPAKVGQSAKIDLQVTGRGGVPASGVSAVVMNVTVTEPTAASFLTAYPAGEAVPDASNLNYGPNDTVPNLVTVKVGPGGKVSLRNNAGNTHMIADVAGWYDAG